jgi:hypothetical protein
MSTMPTNFQEFLRQKVEGSGWKDRKRLRSEWLDALDRLLGQIRGWLGESDPEGVLELVPYEVERVEERLGVYDAPALQIRLNTESADVLPVGRFVPLPYYLHNLLSVPSNRQAWGHLTGGRVDITDGERKHILLRGSQDGQDRWYAVMKDELSPLPFDRAHLEAILEDLLA